MARLLRTPRIPTDPVAREKVFAAEKNVAIVRTLVIVFNVFVYFTLMEKAGTVYWLAVLVSVVAVLYTGLVHTFQPWRRYEAFLSSYFTSATDGSLITLWILATGGFESPFYVLWYLSLAAIAFRYSQRVTWTVGIVYAGLYIGLLAVIGELVVEPVTLLVRVAYIFLIGGLLGLIARETFAQVRGKQEFRQLADMVKAVSTAPRMEAALDHILRTAMSLTASDRGAIYLLEDDGKRLYCAKAMNLSDDYVRARTELFADLPGYQILHEGGYLHIRDAQADTRLKPLGEALEREGFRTYCVFPLILHGDQMGVLSLYRDDVRPFTGEEVLVAQNLANHAATAIENARLFQELRESEERFRAVAVSARDAIVTIDEEGRIVFTNRAATELFAMERAELEGRRIEDLLSAESRRRYVGLSARSSPAEEDPDGIGLQALELEAMRRDGTELPVELSLAHWRAGDRTYHTAIVRDLTERRRAEEERLRAVEHLKEVERLKEMDSFKTQFINTAAHELGTPLTPIRLQLNLLRHKNEADLTQSQRRSLDVLERNVERLITLVKDILEGARLQANRLGIERDAMDLNRVVLEAVESFHEMARSHRVALDTNLEPNLVVYADAKRVTQVLFNFLSNAMKFTPAGGRVTVRTKRVNRMGVVEVADTGIGIEREEIDRLFRPFTQVHDTMQHTKGGTGLGLYISKGIIELHGGRIWAESPGPGLGSTFGFAIPMEQPEETPALDGPQVVARDDEDAIGPPDVVASRVRDLI